MRNAGVKFRELADAILVYSAAHHRDTRTIKSRLSGAKARHRVPILKGLIVCRSYYGYAVKGLFFSLSVFKRTIIPVVEIAAFLVFEQTVASLSFGAWGRR